MPAVKPDELVRATLDALEESGAQGALRSPARRHPREFLVATPDGGTTLWVYVWTITHGGATRSLGEYRIQMTTVQPPLALNPIGETVLLGWDPNLRVFAGFDVARHQTFRPGSNSVQVSLSALRDASSFGWGFYENQRGEIVATFRPSEFLGYVQHARVIHQQGPGAVALLVQAARPEGIVQSLPGRTPVPRRRLIETITRLSRQANFREQVLSAYGHRCAVTGLQLRLVDAAHILPVGAAGSSDEVLNGICLSPTYHRAFDHGLVYLSSDRRMRLDQAKMEQLRDLRLLGGLEGFARCLDHEILLPANPGQWPSPVFIQQANEFRGIAVG